ncbi:anti-sigma factor domain-containing protein [Bacillus sp. H-16]|uniref:anti-sigma-I factor RsgI family protein n=1 Tax=Alteribacter salitolerans TaxID=2912333 RepID=UPI0019652342|nr:anti-sigma factor domain-containing protein [Alteribacter salitolerans]
MKKGVVMEKHKRFMIVLTKEGEFVKAKRSAGARIGEEVPYKPANTFLVSMLYEHKSMTLPVAAVLCFIVFFALPFPDDERAYGVVAFDINPSIGITLDRKYEVVDLIYYNEDGKKILGELHPGDYIGESFDIAAYLILKESKAHGYLEEENSIYISTSTVFYEDQKWLARYEGWTTSIKEEYSINIISLLIDQSTLEEAKARAVSPGKIALSHTYDFELAEVEELRSFSMSQLVSEAGPEMSDILHSGSGEQDMDEVTLSSKQEQEEESPSSVTENAEENKEAGSGSSQVSNTESDIDEEAPVDNITDEDSEPEEKPADYKDEKKQTKKSNEKKDKDKEEKKEKNEKKGHSEKNDTPGKGKKQEGNAQRGKGCSPPGLADKEEGHPSGNGRKNCDSPDK